MRKLWIIGLIIFLWVLGWAAAGLWLLAQRLLGIL